MQSTLIRYGNYILDGLWILVFYWAVFAMGGMGSWPIAILFILVSSAFILWLVLRIYADKDHSRIRHRHRHSMMDRVPHAESPNRLLPILIALCAAYMIFQIIPLPTGFVEFLSPEKIKLQREIQHALNEALPTFTTIALHPTSSRVALTIFAMGLIAMLYGAHIALDRPRVRRMMFFLIILVGLQAFYGVFMDFFGNNRIFWIPHESPYARGTFFNRNHFAALMALFFPISIGWYFFQNSPFHSYNTDLGILYRPTYAEMMSSRRSLWILVPALIIFAVIQSASRGGFMSVVMGSALFFALALRARAGRFVFGGVTFLSLILLTYALSSEYQIVLDRFGELQDKGSGRERIWDNAWGIVEDFPVTGIGLGNFRNIYSRYADHDTTNIPMRAHNEWLEGLLTLGWPAMILVMLTVIVFFYQSLKGIYKISRNQNWLLGCWAGLIGLCGHSIGEFNFHIPALLIISFFIGGLLIGMRPTPSHRKEHAPAGMTEEAEADQAHGENKKAEPLQKEIDLPPNEDPRM